MARTGEPSIAARSGGGVTYCPLDLPVGPRKGHSTTPIERLAKPSHRKGVRSPKSKLVHSIIREVAGYAPYERRIMELLRNSKVSLV